MPQPPARKDRRPREAGHSGPTRSAEAAEAQRRRGEANTAASGERAMPGRNSSRASDETRRTET